MNAHGMSDVVRCSFTRASGVARARASAREVGARDGARARASADARVEAFATRDGVELEVISRRARDTNENKKNKPAIVFIHGSYHAAWCYEEHFAPYFASRGYDTRSVSLRAHGNSGVSSSSASAGTLASHAEDVNEILSFERARANDEGRPWPCIVGHSFGGLVTQRALAPSDGERRASAAVLLASVPPTGNAGMVRRFLMRDLFASAKITYAFATKAFGTNVNLCRDCFFSSDLADADVERFARAINQSSRLRMFDLRALNAKELPVPKPTGANADVPVLVLGGDADFVVDAEGLEETARHYATDGRPVVLPNTAHDVMLDTRWIVAAKTIEKFIENNVLYGEDRRLLG